MTTKETVLNYLEEGNNDQILSEIFSLKRQIEYLVKTLDARNAELEVLKSKLK